MGTLTLEIQKDTDVLWRSCFHLLQWVLPISIAQNILNQKYFGRISVCSVSSPLLHLPQVVFGSLHLMLSLLVCHSTWKSWFLNAHQKPLLPVVKWLKLTYFFLFFNAHQIWTSPYLQQSTSHDLLSHQHPATKDGIKLPSLGTLLAPHTNEPQDRPCSRPSWSKHWRLGCTAETWGPPWMTASCWQLSLGTTGRATHGVILPQTEQRPRMALY